MVRTYHSTAPVEYAALMLRCVVFTADITSIAAADIVHDFLGMMVSSEPPKPHAQRALKKSEEL